MRLSLPQLPSACSGSWGCGERSAVGGLLLPFGVGQASAVGCWELIALFDLLDESQRIGPLTVLSLVSIENTSDMWLSPRANNIAGQ